MHCPRCGAPAADGSTFCMKCGGPLPTKSPQPVGAPEAFRFCGACGNQVRAGDDACSKCGAWLGGLAGPEKSESHLRGLVLLAIGVMLLASVVMGGIYLYRTWRQNQDLAEHYASGSAALQAGDYETAVQQLGWVVERSPDYLDAKAKLDVAHADADSASLFSQAQAFCEQEEWEQAIELLEGLQAGAPDYREDAARSLLASAYRGLGLSLAEGGQFAEAVRRFDQCLALVDDPAVVGQRRVADLYLQGLAALAGGQYDSAIQALGEVYALDPEYGEVGRNLYEAYVADCTAWREAGDLDRAEAMCLAAYKLSPAEAGAAVQLTQVASLRITPSATPTATPIATDAASPTPTPTPVQTPSPPPPAPRSLDDFEGYAGDAALQAAYPLNCAWGANGGSLSLASAPNVGGGSHAVAFSYDIRAGDPNNYCGFERRMDGQDWRRYSVLRFWARSDGSARQLVVQFGESSGEVWKFRTLLSGFGTKEFSLALNQRTFSELAVYPELGDPNAVKYRNGRMDLQAVTYFAFFVGHGSLGPGQIYIDSVELR